MDSEEFILKLGTRQAKHTSGTRLRAADRRLLLGASLRLLARRYTCGKRISKNDVMRVARFADDSEMETVWRQSVLGADKSLSPGP
jgi:hypothetical protein